MRAQDGARLLFKLPKSCQLVDESAAAEAKKKTAGQTDVQYLAGYWCYGDSEHTELSGVVVVTYQSSAPPPLTELRRACGLSLQPRLAWLRQHFGDFGSLEVSDARCDEALQRITLIGTDPRIKTLDVSRMTMVPGTKGVALVNTMHGSKTTAESLRVSLEDLAESISVRDAPSAAPASPARP